MSDRIGSTSNSAPPKRFRTWVLVLIVIAAAAGCWIAWSRIGAKAIAAGRLPPGETVQSPGNAGRKGGRGGGSMVVPVTSAKAYRGDIPVYLTGLGSVEAFYTVTVRSRVDGELMDVPVQEGQYVNKGDLLAQIDPRPFQAQLEQAEGQMARDQATLTNAKLDLSRYETLIRQEAIPKQQLDTQLSTVRQTEGAIKQDQAAIDTAKLNLIYSRITAPISGRIGLRQVDPGNIVHASDTTGLLVITQLQPIAALFTIPEDSLPPVLKKLRAGAKLHVDAYNRDYSTKLDTGTLLTVDNQIDPTTGTSRLKAVFENRGGLLFPNQFVNVRLLVDTERGQVIIPSVALQRGQQGTFVYVIKPDNTVEARTVVPGITVAEIVSIQNGIEPGEMVVTEGTDKLQPGSQVRARPEAVPPLQRHPEAPTAPVLGNRKQP
jgi:multidrug efflux system membrane fusion protein